MENLLNFLQTFQPLSSDLRTYLRDNLISASFPARHVLLEVPKVASHIYYIADGAAMSYRYDRDGKIIESFWKTGDLAVAFESYIYQRPSLEVIQLLTPCDLLCLSHSTMTEMFILFPEATGTL